MTASDGRALDVGCSQEHNWLRPLYVILCAVCNGPFAVN